MHFSLFLGLFVENIWWVWGRIRGFAVSIDNESEKSTLALLFIFFCKLQFVDDITHELAVQT